jgi:hypothetical protein
MACVVLVWSGLGEGISKAGAADVSSVDFNRDIRPLLSDNCIYCHGPDATHRKADLRLDTEAGAKADLGGYHAIVEGDSTRSEMVARIRHEDPDERMPPPDSGKSLTPAQKELLTRWISQGAPWSQHWAYVPPQKHPEPSVKATDWSLHWIDRFILSRLEAEGLSPAPDADNVTLIRRLSFDLTGLPPTREAVMEFLSDPGENAYEKAVDRLLASPAYGERMAVYWLDLVRYADTVGYHGDQDHNISPYRDWVIDAFNQNMPFDEFTREQLAGDLLPNAGMDQKIASGYNRLLQTSHEGGVQPKEYLAIYTADRVRNVSSVWMGATLGCSQCHDHKYDPYTAKDFFSMAAFFADIDEAGHFSKAGNTLPTQRPPEIQVLTRLEREHLADLKEALKTLQADEASVSGQERDGLTARIERIQAQIADREKNARMTMITVSIKPRPMRLLPRGNWLDDSGPLVNPAVPEFLSGQVFEGRGRATRLDLANWLMDSEQGSGTLTARVFANRFWYLLFGVGIARVMDDFGGQGEPPVHPELLDRLAWEFVENGWNIKRLMKTIAMSRSYRQSSRAEEALLNRDPYNQLFARQSRYRLSAEMVRDNALAISGLLVDALGGPSVKPYQPAGYYRHLNFPQREYKHDSDERQWRRGVYMHWQRQFLHPMLKAFDAPSREECTAERSRSNTPLAALALLNDPTFVEAGRKFAERILLEGGPTLQDRLVYAFDVAVSRPPDAFERRAMAKLWQSNWEHYRADENAARQLLMVGEAEVLPELDPAELAAWTMVARALLNLDETMTRN